MERLPIPEKELGEAERLFQNLNNLSRNSKIPVQTLVDRAEFIPSDISLDSDSSDDEVIGRENQMMAAALVVSKLTDRMTDSEFSVAQGIMAGYTYEEIGAMQDPPRSSSWVRMKLDTMRERFTKEGI